MKRTFSTFTATMAVFVSAPAFAGPYEDFFQAAPANIFTEVMPATSPPKIYVSNNLDADLRRWLEDGYLVVGSSSFVGGYTEPKKAIGKAKKLKAEIILYSSNFVETRSGGAMIMPMAMGVPGALAVPLSVNRYAQTAVFLSKLQQGKIGLGFRYRYLEPNEIQSAGTNRAVAVVYTIRNSPAFNADILPGDIILSVGGVPITDEDGWSRLKAEMAGKLVPMELIRSGQAKTLQIKLPAARELSAEK